MNLLDMGFDIQRQRFLRAINSKYIYGTIVSELKVCTFSEEPHTDTTSVGQQPLLHAIVILLEMAIIARITAKFNAYYGAHPG
jgi:protein Mpv17